MITEPARTTPTHSRSSADVTAPHVTAPHTEARSTPSRLSGIRRRTLLATVPSAVAWVVASKPLFAAARQRWRVGVIGHTGRGDYGHGMHTVWLKMPETEIVGLADADGRGRARVKQQVGVEHAFADYHQMLQQTRPEIVAVCPRHVDQHHAMIMAAIEGGAKGIYCEKPFCSTLAEADEVVAACEQAGVRLAIAHRNRYHPVLPVITKAIEAGVIGDLLEIRCRGKEDRRGGGEDLWVLGTHLFNLVDYFSGPPIACSAVLLDGARPVSRADVDVGAEGLGLLAGNRLHARYQTESGQTVYFDSIRGHGIAAAGFGLQLIGNQGIIDLRIDAEPLAHFIPGNPFQPSKTPRPWLPITSGGIDQDEPIDNIKALVGGHLLATRDLLSAISESRPPLCSAAAGRTTLEMVHATFASHLQDGRRVAIPLDNRSHPLAAWSPNKEAATR